MDKLNKTRTTSALSTNSNRANMKSLLLNKLATQKGKIVDVIDNREFRIVTGADDGHVFFWNIPYDLINEAKIALENSKKEPMPRLSMSKKNSKMSSSAAAPGFRKIPEFKPKFELFLSGYA